MPSRLMIQSQEQSQAWLDTTPQPWVPHDYQKRAVKFLLERACGGLLLDPGMGKTSIALAAFKLLKKRNLVSRLLLVAPLRPCHLVWPQELWKWSDFHDLTFRVLHGDKKDRLLAQELEDPSDVVIVNVDGLMWLLGASATRTAPRRSKVSVDTRRAKSLGFDVLCVDELSKFKHVQSQRFKAMKPILSMFARRWGLTGSPNANGLEGLFGETFILDEGKTFGPYITHFRNKFFVPSPDGFGWSPQEDAEERIYKELKPLMLRLDPAANMDLPEIAVNDIMVDLPAPARKAYDTMEKDLLLQLEGTASYAANGGVLAGKLRQIANGGLFVEEPNKPRTWVEFHTQKVDAVADLVEELQGEPLFVAYDFEHDLDRLLKRLGKDTPILGNGNSTKKDSLLESAWNRGELPVLLAHPASVGHGLNLQKKCRHVCWHSLTYDFELYDQFNKRVARQGNPYSRVTIHRIQARNTVDQDVACVLAGKARGQDALFKALLARARRKG